MSEIKILPKSVSDKIMQEDNRSLLTKTRDFIYVNYKIIIIVIVIIIIIVFANKLYSKFYAAKDVAEDKVQAPVVKDPVPQSKVSAIEPVVEKSDPQMKAAQESIENNINDTREKGERENLDEKCNEKTFSSEERSVCTKISADIDQEIAEIDNEA